MRTILFLLLTISLHAQKSEQVKSYLGEAKYFDKPLSGRVDFVFEKGSLNRKTDGSKTYAEILPDAYGFSDSDNAGKLKEIRVNSVLIARHVASAVVPESSRPINFQVPDSISFLEQTEQLKKKATFWEGQMWAMIKPVWSVVMHFFWILFPLCLVVMGALWFWAKLSASEEFSGLHYKTSKALTLAVGGTWTVFLINGFMTVVSMEMGFVGLVFCTSLLCVIAYKSAAWIVPNFRQKPGGRTMSNFNNRQLNG